MKKWKIILAICLSLIITGCGGGGGSSGGNATPPITNPTTYIISGSVSGLGSGKQVALLNNAGNTTTVSNNGAFNFSTPVSQNGAYAVTIGTQPTGQTCTISNGSGTGVAANISNVTVNCSDITYTISGSVSGLGSGKQVTLLNNTITTVSNNGAFSFSTPVSQDGTYDVSISTQPNGQTCTVSNGSGTGVANNINNVTVNCSDIKYTISGVVVGLEGGKQVTLFNNAGNATTVSNNGVFSFSTPVSQGGTYAVTISIQPTGQTCTVSGGNGIGVTNNINHVIVNCSDTTYTISGTVSGLESGKQVTLLNNAGNPTTVSNNGAFSFSTPVSQGGTYAVTISTQPTGQTCIVNNSSGTSVSANIANVQITCTTLGVTTKIGANDSYARAAAIQTDGKIVVVGVGDNDFALTRYNVNGSLDSSFGSAGVATTNISGRIASTDWARAVAIQNDGKILVVGYTQKNGDVAKGLALLRYNPNGSLDTSFAGSGIVISLDSAKDKTGHAVAIQPDGKIVIAGAVNCTNRTTPGFCTLLERYNIDGSLDTTFNGPGAARIDTYTKGAQGLALQGDGKILVVGSKDNGNGDELSVARYKSDGQIDSSFGSAGLSTVAIGSAIGSFNNGTGIALQADGNIVVAGVAHSSSGGNHFSLTRLTTNGSVDTSFGNAGSVVTNASIPPESDFSYGVAVQANGKIVVAGESTTARTNTLPYPGFYSAANVNFAAVRYTTTGNLDTSFGGTGIVTTDVNFLDDRCYGLALQPNGSLILVGESFTYDPSNNDGGYSNFAVVRFKQDGSVDETFTSRE